jgi:microcystin-dependent protein
VTEPFVGEIRAFGFNFAPTGWAVCNGALLPIAQNTALFSLLGTQFGGNGTSNFALPNLLGQAAMGAGQGPGLSDRFQGEAVGVESVTLLVSEIPNHRHVVRATAASGTASNPVGAIPAASEEQLLYGTGTDVAMASPSLAGGSQPHENRQPFLGINFCIALQGVFPPRP